MIDVIIKDNGYYTTYNIHLYPSLTTLLEGFRDPGIKLSRAIAPGMVSHGKQVQGDEQD